MRGNVIKIALDFLDTSAHDVGKDPSLDNELALAYQRVGAVQGNPTNTNLGDMRGALESYAKGLLIAQRMVAHAPNDARARRTLALGYEAWWT